ncbi:MAG: chitinase [Treponema sp.]|nr:chitinase [Treponema sp.]
MNEVPVEKDKGDTELKGTVILNGDAEVGGKLTVDVRGLNGTGNYSYQWLLNSSILSGEVKDYYFITIDDINSEISVRVTSSDKTGSAIGGPTNRVTRPGDPPLKGTVSIAGTPEVGKQLLVNTSGLDAIGGFSFRWMYEGWGTISTSKNSPNYTLEKGDVGKRIIVQVTRTGSSGSVTSPAVGPVKDATVAPTPEAPVTPPPPPPAGTSPNLTLTKNLKDATYMQHDDPAMLEADWDSNGAGKVDFQWFKASSKTGAGIKIGELIEWKKPATYTPQTDTIGTTYYWVEMYNTAYYPEGLKTSTTKSHVAEIKVTQRTGGSGIGTDDTKPDAVVKRFQSYLSKADFEALFPRRVGSPGWKDYMQTNGGHAAFPNGEWQKYEEYYSYDNLIAAIEEIARWAYVLETRDVTGGYTRANSKGYIVEKSTGNRYPVFTGENFNGRNEKIIKTTVDYGSFLSSKNDNDNRRELAGLLANMAHETGAGWETAPGGEEAWGLFFNEEVDVVAAGGYTDTYTQQGHPDYPPVPGQSYHGRGGIQLSWNYNYGPFSIMAFGDKNELLKNPGRVSKEGKLGWMSGIWFWMTPSLPKASCHDVMQSTWKPEGVFASGANRGISWGFGATIIVINGGLESGGGEKLRRARHYRQLAEKTGANIEGEKIDTKGMSPWT